MNITSFVYGQRVVAKVDSAHIMIGDHLNLYLKIMGSDGITNPRADLSPIDTAQAFELVKEGDWEKIVEDDKSIYQKQLTITSFDSGYYFIPSIKVQFNNGNKKIGQNTQKIQLAVVTPKIDSLQIRTIKNIVAEPVSLADYMPIILSVLGFLLLCLIGYFIYKRIQNKPAQEVYVVPKPPHEIALNKLKALSEKELWQKGMLKEYQSELTYIVREYLEKRYNIQALESTTAEIIKELKNEDISEEHKTQLSDMFRMADMVKFAKATPPIDTQSRLLNEAESFITNTKKEVVAEPLNPEEA
jgi:hypothetical protein